MPRAKASKASDWRGSVSDCRSVFNSSLAKKNKKILQTVNVVLLRIETVTVSRQLEVMICESQHLR